MDHLYWSWQDLSGLLLFFSLICLRPVPLWAVNTTFYVDFTGGNDGNPGTAIDAAWKTMANVSGKTTFGEGDRILFKRGEVWHEPLVIASSGAVGNPIVFGAYGTGDPPLFDGSTTVTWNNLGGGIYSAAWSTGDPGLIIYKGTAKPSITTLQFSAPVPAALKKNAVLLQTDGTYKNFWVTSRGAYTVSGITFYDFDPALQVYVRQLNAGGVEEKWTTSLGTPTVVSGTDSLTEPGHWYWDSNTLYLYSDTVPSDADVQVGTLARGIYSNGMQFITIQDLAVQGYQETGVYLKKTQDSTVRNLQVANIGKNGHKTGIFLECSKNNLIEKNSVESPLRTGIAMFWLTLCTDQQYSESNTISGNSISHPGSSGISLNAVSRNYDHTIVNNTITQNTIYNANSLAYDSAGVYALWTGSNTIDANTILHGGSEYLRGAGIMLDDDVAPSIVTNNIIENNSLGGVVVTGSGHEITGNKLTDNGVLSWNSAQIVLFEIPGTPTASCSVQSNTMVATGNRKLFHVDNGSADPSHGIDNNVYRAEESSGFCWGCGDQWTGFSTWKNQSGQDAHSTFSLITTPSPSPPPSGKSMNGTYLLLL